MIQIQSTKWALRWLWVAVAAGGVAYIGHRVYDFTHVAQPDGGDQREASAPWMTREVRGESTSPSSGALVPSPNQAASAAENGDGASAALDTGMEDWQKPENVALRAELQRWYDHREETSMAQRRADASALMAKIEARQAAGKINSTSAALAKLMLLQGAPSDDPQHAVQLQQVMTQLAGQLSFGE